MDTSAIDRARDFLAHRRVAVVGISRGEKDFTRMVDRELRRRGYDVVPVNPAARELDGRACAARVQEIRPPPEWALFFTPPERTEQAVRDCLEAGVRRVWIHRGAGPGAASPAALELCRSSGVEVVAGLCPFMALPGAGLPHRVHGFFRRRSLARRAPERVQSPRATG